LAASGASDQDVFMNATFLGGSNDTIGGHVQRPELKISQICPLQFSLIHGSSPPPCFVVTGDNCSLVLLSPAIKLSLVSLSLATLLTDVAGTCDKFILLSTTPAITENP
jgi:hypothetical protein